MKFDEKFAGRTIKFKARSKGADGTPTGFRIELSEDWRLSTKAFFSIAIEDISFRRIKVFQEDLSGPLFTDTGSLRDKLKQEGISIVKSDKNGPVLSIRTERAEGESMQVHHRKLVEALGKICARSQSSAKGGTFEVSDKDDLVAQLTKALTRDGIIGTRGDDAPSPSATGVASKGPKPPEQEIK